MNLRRHAPAIGALADDTRRELYDFVRSQPSPVTRDQAAEAVRIAPHNARHHLDRLVAEGLLDVEFRRLTGRTGPGAGRPSKLYRRSPVEFAVSVPPRRYDLVGDILASAVTTAADGTPLADAVRMAAHTEGVTAGSTSAAARDLDGVAEVLAAQGYEPHVDADSVTLTNCPFDALAHKHTDLVCGLNVAYVQGVADGLGATHTRACLEPEAGHCCVRVRRE